MAKARTVINDRWNRENTKRVVCTFMLKSDADIIARLDKQDNKTDYIRQLIRQDIENNPDPEQQDNESL